MGRSIDTKLQGSAVAGAACTLLLAASVMACERAANDVNDAMDGPPIVEWEMDAGAEPAELLVINRTEQLPVGPGHILVEAMVLDGTTQRQIELAMIRLGQEELARDDVHAARLVIFVAVADDQRPGEAQLVPAAWGEALQSTGWGDAPSRGMAPRVYVHFGEAPW